MKNIKYPLYSSTENPPFEYFVKNMDSDGYYLFDNINDAMWVALDLSTKDNEHTLMYEKVKDEDGRYAGRHLFTMRNREISYYKYSGPELSLVFYVNDGIWRNPNINLVKCPKCGTTLDMFQDSENHYFISCPCNDLEYAFSAETKDEAIKLFLDFYEPKDVFEYCGYYYVPVRKFTEEESKMPLKKMSQYLANDYSLELRYNYDIFYKASNNSECDIFLCLENKKLYVPGRNYLFEWLKK